MNQVINWLRRNAVVLLPVAYTVAEAVDGLHWTEAVPVAIGIVLRQFFTSPTHEVMLTKPQFMEMLANVEEEARAVPTFVNTTFEQAPFGAHRVRRLDDGRPTALNEDGVRVFVDGPQGPQDVEDEGDYSYAELYQGE